MNDVESYVRERLFALQDSDFREFNAKLIPTVDFDRVIGVRTPALRKFAKEFFSKDGAREYMACLPHQYFEENNLHAFMIELIREYDEAIAALEQFLPYLDNWATCDQLRPKVLGKNTDLLIDKVRLWLKSSQPYTVRYAIGMLLSYYLDAHFQEEHLHLVSDIRSEEYYINIMRAWYFATALAKQYSSAIVFLEEGCLDLWTHNKTIQKAIESYRISNEQKSYLRTLKRKK